MIQKNETPVDVAIKQVADEMEKVTPGTPAYSTLTEQLERLYKAKSHVRETLFTPDTLLIVGGNLVGILAILTYEKANVITSKALGFILRSKI